MTSNENPDFADLIQNAADRCFEKSPRTLVGHVPTIAITPVADGRVAAFSDNAAQTWELTEKVYNLITENVKLPDGTPVRVVIAPEIVYGARTGAIAQKYYATQGVCANIWVSRCWSYSDELMSACMGIGSSEWQQAAYGLNQTDRPGAVWLKAFTAAMDEKKRPIFCIYNPDLEDESAPLCDFVAERLLRFARCATAVGEIRGKNYLSVGSVSMGIIGSDVRRNLFHQYLGMGTASYDMVGVKGRMDNKFYDEEEVKRGVEFMKKNFKFDFGEGERPQPGDKLIEDCVKMTIIVRDLMIGNENLADMDTEFAQGYNAIASGTQGQRQWTDLYPNFDMVESLLNSSFDWNGRRAPMTVATENDSKNAMGMMIATLLTGLPQMFADIRTNWTAKSIKDATGVDVSDICADGLIDKRNSGAAALDYAVNIYKVAGADVNEPPYKVAAKIAADPALADKIMQQAMDATTYTGAGLGYFLGDGLSSNYRTPGGVPMTAYRYNCIDNQLTCSIVEGDTVELPEEVAAHISEVTDKAWPEAYWKPRGMSSYEYMSKIGPNHDANSFGYIGADMITINAMLRIPIDMHNVAESDIFRPTMWDRFAGDDYRVCEYLGPIYM